MKKRAGFLNTRRDSVGFGLMELTAQSSTVMLVIGKREYVGAGVFRRSSSPSPTAANSIVFDFLDLQIYGANLE
jgi:hypothetical protein